MSDSYNTLTAEEKYVIQQKGTERPFVGIYTDHFGIFFTKVCVDTVTTACIIYWGGKVVGTLGGWVGFTQMCVDTVTCACIWRGLGWG